jgi:hypothetical protein
MKHKKVARMEFTRNIENSSIELLKAIRGHSQNYQEHQYSMSIVLDSLRGLLGNKQKEGETLQDWTKRFRITCEVLQSHMGGPIVIDKIAKAMPEYATYDISSIKKCHNKAYERFLANLYIENTDRTKYGSILAGLNTQQSLGKIQYPKTVTEANNVLSNHKLDTTNKSKKVHEEFKNKYKKNNRKEEEDSYETEINLSFAQSEGKCFCCAREGHKSPQCRLNDHPRNEWTVIKAQKSFAQLQNQNTISTNNNPTNESQASRNQITTGWAGTHIQYTFAQADEMRS